MQLIFKELMGDHHLPGFLTTTLPSQQALPVTAWSQYMFVFMLGNSVRARLDAVTGSFWPILPLSSSRSMAIAHFVWPTPCFVTAVSASINAAFCEIFDRKNLYFVPRAPSPQPPHHPSP